MRLTPLLLAIALAACATETPYVIENVGQARDVLVRWNAETTTREEVDAEAVNACGGAAEFRATERRFDGFTYARYRCGS